MTAIELEKLTDLRKQKLSVGEAVVCILADDGMDMKEIATALDFTPQAARHAMIRGNLKIAP